MELRKLAALDQLLQEAVVLCETFFGTGHWMFKPLKSALSQNVQKAFIYNLHDTTPVPALQNHCPIQMCSMPSNLPFRC